MADTSKTPTTYSRMPIILHPWSSPDRRCRREEHNDTSIVFGTALEPSGVAILIDPPQVISPGTVLIINSTPLPPSVTQHHFSKWSRHPLLSPRCF